MIKLIVTDVDGTIVGKDEILHQEMIDYVKGLAQKEIYYTIATGRVDGLISEYVRKMGIVIPYVTCNGAAILQQGRVIVRKTIPLSALQEIIFQADEMGMSVLYSIAGKENAYRETDYVRQQQLAFNRYQKPGRFSPWQWETVRLDKVIIMARVRDGSIGVIEKLCQKLPSEFGYKRYADKAIDILHGEATKEAGVRELARMLNIPIRQVLFAGDDINDIQALKQAGIGVAVANAQPAAKQAADYIAEQECYQGVIEGIEKFVIKGERL